MRLSDSPTTTLLLCEVLSASGSSNNRRKATVFCRDADLFTQQKRASPRDGPITQSTRKAVTAGTLFCFVEKPTGGGNRHLEGLTMNDDRMTVVPDFLGELDAGVFMNKIAAALNTVGLGV
ncbi:hypothetical protein RZ42_004909, partial [Salmonella enterica subsp. enterica]|nr:hypothetical protein [Salmonella enterica subsp. enterica]